jgi:hypothetical protein
VLQNAQQVVLSQRYCIYGVTCCFFVARVDGKRIVIGAERLEKIDSHLQRRGAQPVCRGRFVLEAQRQLYGSRASLLTRRELQEVIEYYELRAMVGGNTIYHLGVDLEA